MANDTRGENSNAKLIWRIAISGIVITIVIFISLIFLSGRPKKPNRDPLPLSPSVPTSASTQPPLQKCTLFFFDARSLALVREERQLGLPPDLIERLKQIITELLGNSINGFQKTIPNDTFLYEAYIDDQSIAYLDFSAHLKNKHIGGTTAEMLTVKTILETIQANFPDQIKNVQILIEGLEAYTIAGHVDISKPLTLLPDSVKSVEENAIEFP